MRIYLSIHIFYINLNNHHYVVHIFLTKTEPSLLQLNWTLTGFVNEKIEKKKSIFLLENYVEEKPEMKIL